MIPRKFSGEHFGSRSWRSTEITPRSCLESILAQEARGQQPIFPEISLERILAQGAGGEAKNNFPPRGSDFGGEVKISPQGSGFWGGNNLNFSSGNPYISKFSPPAAVQNRFFSPPSAAKTNSSTKSGHLRRNNTNHHFN